MEVANVFSKCCWHLKNLSNCCSVHLPTCCSVHVSNHYLTHQWFKSQVMIFKMLLNFNISFALFLFACQQSSHSDSRSTNWELRHQVYILGQLGFLTIDYTLFFSKISTFRFPFVVCGVNQAKVRFITFSYLGFILNCFYLAEVSIVAFLLTTSFSYHFSISLRVINFDTGYYVLFFSKILFVCCAHDAKINLITLNPFYDRWKIKTLS